MATTVLDHPDARIRIEEDAAARVVDVTPQSGVFTAARRWSTAYPLELVEHVLRVKGPGRLCDEIMRDEDPRYIQHSFQWGILGYLDPDEVDGRRILDFGSGCGASSMVLSRMFPRAHIVGVELVEAFVELARHRARHYGVADRVEFQLSPDSRSLPAGLGQFDIIVFSAAYEHLLPQERRSVMPMVWSHPAPRRRAVPRPDALPLGASRDAYDRTAADQLPARWAHHARSPTLLASCACGHAVDRTAPSRYSRRDYRRGARRHHARRRSRRVA